MSATLDPAVFRKAADVIRTGGHVKGVYERGTAHCAVGALQATMGMRTTVTLYEEAVFLAGLLGEGDSVVPTAALVSWNDRPERTPADVITLLEQAAEKLEADQ